MLMGNIVDNIKNRQIKKENGFKWILFYDQMCLHIFRYPKHKIDLNTFNRYRTYSLHSFIWISLVHLCDMCMICKKIRKRPENKNEKKTALENGKVFS